MDAPGLQNQLFNAIKNVLPSNVSFVDRIAELLNISIDSTYRRIRGETALTLAELKILCKTFHISLDQVLELESSALVFHDPDINNNGDLDFRMYLQGILERMKFFNNFKKRQMLYLCKDAPIFHFYIFPELAAFKSFFWMKTIQDHPDYRDRKFEWDEKGFREYFQLGQQILEEYNQLPSTELWNFETLNSTISQIRYYREAEIFASATDFDLVVDSFIRTVEHIQLQVEKGIKFKPQAGEAAYRSPIQFFINEVIIGNNTILLDLDDTKMVLVNYRVLNYMITKDVRFCQRAFSNFTTLQSKSNLISASGEKERKRFFNSIIEKVRTLKYQTTNVVI